jgi:hypothetical protein
MGQWSGLWTENVREIGSGRPILDPGLLQNVKELLDAFFLKLMRYSGVMKPRPLWYESTGREDSTPVVWKL